MSYDCSVSFLASSSINVYIASVLRAACSSQLFYEVIDSVVGATMSATGFITFEDLHSVTCAAKTPLFHKPDVLIAKMAPEPRDVM